MAVKVAVTLLFPSIVTMRVPDSAARPGTELMA